MPIIVQDDDGLAAGANAYTDVAAFKAYHADRGNDVSAHADPAIEQAIVQASDYVDVRFSYVGRRANRDQSTAWPRSGARDFDGYSLTGVPRVVKEAAMEYAFRALTGELMPDPQRDSTGREVLSQSKTVGPISTSFTYAQSSEGATSPRYPLADNMLRRAGLVRASNTVSRA